MSTNHAETFFLILDDLLSRDAPMSVHQVLVETSWLYKEWLKTNQDVQDTTPDVQWTEPTISQPTGIDPDAVRAVLDVLEDLNTLTMSVLNNYIGNMNLAPTCIADAIKTYNDWYPEANRLVTIVREMLEGIPCETE